MKLTETELQAIRDRIKRNMNKYCKEEVYNDSNMSADKQRMWERILKVIGKLFTMPKKRRRP